MSARTTAAHPAPRGASHSAGRRPAARSAGRPSIAFAPMHLPASVESPDAGEFLAFTGAANAMWRSDSSTDLFREDPAEWLVGLRETTYVDKSGIVARRGEEIVGFAGLACPRAAKRTAHVDIVIHPDRRDDDEADALLAEIERRARERGRTSLRAFAFASADAGGDRLPSPTGSGSLPRDAWQTRFLVRNGYALGQVERASVFDLQGSFEAVDRLLEAAVAKAGPDYRVAWWQTPTPEEHIEGYAAAISRLDGDAPSGELPVEADPWDAQRVRDREDLKRRAGQTMAVTVVIHEPTGQVAAYNELVIGADRTAPTENYGTLVMPEHRGRRLGTIVKCVGLRRWSELVPTSPVVRTFNAEENRYMLDVNEAVGFRPAAYTGEWTKELT
ncbi:GNAT family N-acetyltransferase [Microbacterium barkeri]|nr:GNAT family N-acetyltransferase [Microbacterium barkeri]MDR6875840.1 GNAT superfamily N-acetyltransferase [Microbacterium barkeri]